jgi:hypothetical protein
MKNKRLHQVSLLAVLSFSVLILNSNALIDNDSSVAASSKTKQVLAAKKTATPSPTPTPSASPSPTPTPALAKKAKTKAPATKAAPAAGTPGGQYGIANNLARIPAAELAQRIDAMRALGITWVRYDIEWSNIQYGGSGQYDWSSYDRVVQAVSARGINSLLVISYTPSWARPGSCSSPMCAPASADTYAGFTAAVANRYKGYGVHAYEIWNEPNNLNFFLPAANPALYTAMLKASYSAIKATDPQATVITGGTSPAGNSGGYMSPINFVNAIYANGGQGYFDAVAHHPYTWPYSPAFNNPYDAWGQLTSIHNTMTSHGDGSKKIWMTEFGAPTGGPGGLATNGMSTSEAHDDHVSEALQAKIITDAINISRGYSWAGPFFLYSYKDAGTASDTVENFFGLLRADGSQKPSYAAFQAAIR